MKRQNYMKISIKIYVSLSLIMKNSQNYFHFYLTLKIMKELKMNLELIQVILKQYYMDIDIV